MTSFKIITGAALLFVSVLFGRTAGSAAGFSQAPAAPVQAPGGGAPGGGGRGNPAAPLFDEQCAGCHGTDLSGGRAISLFDKKWLASVDDARLTSAIKNGVENTEMGGYATSLTDAQVWSLILYMRTQSGRLNPKPAYVANPDGVVIKSEKQAFKIEVLTTDVNTPYGLAFLPDGRLLITERIGALRVLDVKTKKLSPPVTNLPRPHVQQDAGYLDVTVHPDYARNGWIYLAYAEDLPGYVAPPVSQVPVESGRAAGPGGNRPPQAPWNTVIIRGKLNTNNEWTNQELIHRAPLDSYSTVGSHPGLDFLWDKQGHLYFTLGERGAMQNAQDLKTPLGKILRINDDGSAPKDNPFVNTPAADPRIWSWGHRSQQGLAWDPVTGLLWESEHGPTGGDEINVIEKGHNYGWGIASKGSQGGITKTSEPGMDDPIVYYTPAIAPAAIAFYTGTRYPGWKNTSLFVTGLIGQQLRRLEISGNKVIHQEVVFDQFGRLRDIVQGPDGYFYIALQSPTGIPNPAGGGNISLSANTPGSVIRLIPAE